jgi:hypothetical protein
MHVVGTSASAKFDAAHAAAAADDEAAQLAVSRGDHRTAAKRYLDCASRFRAIVAADPMRFAATADAKICYANAITAFANAGRLDSQGRAALEQATATDPPLADAIRRLLDAAPSECTLTNPQ